MSAAYRALEDVLAGQAGVIPAGELVPDTFVDSLGAEQQVDFERLLDLGVVQDARLPYPPDGDARGASSGTDAPDDAPGDLGRLKVDELKQLAADRGVPTVDGAKKADIIAALEAADPA